MEVEGGEGGGGVRVGGLETGGSKWPLDGEIFGHLDAHDPAHPAGIGRWDWALGVRD